MSRPPLNPEKTVSGIAVDPRTLERVIPESKRPDGSVRKQIKIRPGFTPQEDVRRFRGTKQTQMDAHALPKGHIIGWTPPSALSSNATGSGGAKLSKSAKKNAKRREKKDSTRETVRDDWEDEEEDGDTKTPTAGDKGGGETVDKASEGGHTPNQPNWAVAAKDDGEKGKLKAETPIATRTVDDSSGVGDKLAEAVEKLEVR